MNMVVENFWVILGDLVRSRFIKDRGELQSELLSSLKRINRDFREDIWAPLKITRGDEVSGVLLTVKNLIKILTPIVDSVAPNMMRFVVFKGTLSAGVSTRDASLIDGPAFHLAEKEMERLKSKELYLVIFKGMDEKLDSAISLIATFLFQERVKWSKRQREIVYIYEREKSQKQVAQILGVSQQSISVTLKRARYYLLKEAEQWIERVLKGNK